MATTIASPTATTIATATAPATSVQTAAVLATPTALAASTPGAGDRTGQPRSAPLAAGTYAAVEADGDCLYLRAAAGLDAPTIACIATGAVLSVLDGSVEADGYRWQKVGAGALTGWAADTYLKPSALAPAAGVTPFGAGLPVASSSATVLSPAALDQALAASPWPKELWPTVKRIIQCESGGNTAAAGPLGHRGLMQVDPKLHGPVPSDAVGQLTQAYDVYLKQGWSAWACY